jgi:surfeit locus 1 family protein
MTRFRPGLRMSVLVILLIPLTVRLGFWQLDRAAQKRAIEDARLASFGALPVDEASMVDAPAFARVRIEGHFDGDHQFLLDNQTRRGVPGYAVVTPFETIGGRRVLVNRGWVAAPSSRNDLPDPRPPASTVRIVGVLWAASDGTSDVSEWNSGWPKRIERFDGQRMGEALRGSLRTEFRLEEEQPGSLAPIVLGEEMSATRHVGYAFQWFATALALLVAFVVLGLRRGREQ